MKNIIEGKMLIRKILKTLAMGAAITIILSSPTATRRVIKNIIYDFKGKKLKQKYLMQKFYYLRKKELVSFKKLDDKIELVITENGKSQLLKYDLDNLEITNPQKWDEHWRLVFFDIPETKKAAREALVSKLKDLGFLKFNNSVWVYPYECQKEIDFVAEIFEVGRFVHYLTTLDITNEKHLRAKFNLE